MILTLPSIIYPAWGYAMCRLIKEEQGSGKTFWFLATACAVVVFLGYSQILGDSLMTLVETHDLLEALLFHWSLLVGYVVSTGLLAAIFWTMMKNTFTKWLLILGSMTYFSYVFIMESPLWSL